MKIGLAFRAFFTAMFDREAAERMALALDDDTAAPAIEQVAKPEPAPPKPMPKELAGQNPAITLLATLQRDARLIDLIHENLDQYQDAQVGAAARPCLKQCRQSLDRMLKIERLVDATENERIEVPSEASSARYRWIGETSASETSASKTSNDENSASESTNAKLVHPGWQATATDLPQWTGDLEDAKVIAPAQVSQ